MSYDPSHRNPPRQERSPHATPPTGWPPCRDDDYPDGEHVDSRRAADRRDGYPATAGHRLQGASGEPGDRGYRSAVATDTFPPARNGYGSAPGYGPVGGYPSGGYAGGVNGYADAAGDFIEAANGYAGTVGGYPSAEGDRAAIWSPRGGATAQRQRLRPVIGTRDQRAATRRAWRRIQLLPFRQSIARVSGLGSKATMTRLLAAEAFLGERHQAAADTAVPVRVRELGGNVVWLRPRSTDRLALEFVDYGYHLPPAALTGPVRHIAVFGANIGLLMGDLAGRYPQARLLGVEPDHDNALLARRNLVHLGGRCALEEAAVWYRDETAHPYLGTRCLGPDHRRPGPRERLRGHGGAYRCRRRGEPAGRLHRARAGRLPAGQYRVRVVRDAPARPVDRERALHHDRDPGPLRRGGPPARDPRLPSPVAPAQLGCLRDRHPPPLNSQPAPDRRDTQR